MDQKVNYFTWVAYFYVWLNLILNLSHFQWMDRLDFVEFILTAGTAATDLGLCDTKYDSFVVSGGSGTSTTSKIPTICGVNTGLHSKLLSSTGAPLVKNQFIKNHKYDWKISVGPLCQVQLQLNFSYNKLVYRELQVTTNR